MTAPVVAVFTAAGSGQRLGGNGPKALVEINGKPLLTHALENLLGQSHLIDAYAVTIPPGFDNEFSEAIRKVGGPAGEIPYTLTVGGASRQASVFAGLVALKEKFAQLIGPETVVLVHDAARCFTPEAVAGRVVAAVLAGASTAVPGLAVADTIKEIASQPANLNLAADGVGSLGKIEKASRTLDRSRLRAVQTPQGFRFAELLRAHEEFAERGLDEASSASDDASLVEAYGGPSVIVEGDGMAYKITTPTDLALAELLRLRHDK